MKVEDELTFLSLGKREFATSQEEDIFDFQPIKKKKCQNNIPEPRINDLFGESKKDFLLFLKVDSQISWGKNSTIEGKYLDLWTGD